MASPPARRSAMIALVAIAEPIELGVNGLPFGAMTLAPALRQRSASRISAVMTTAVELARSAIQSSAASKPDPTTLRGPSGWTGQRPTILLTMERGHRTRCVRGKGGSVGVIPGGGGYNK